METLSLKVQRRDLADKPQELRAKNLIPGIFYHRGEENIPLSVDYQTLRRAYQKAGESTVVEIQMDDGSKKMTLIHDISYDSMSGNINHVDFRGVSMTEKIDTMIPIEFTGVSTAIKDFGGMLLTNLDEIEVRCFPQDLVHNITVDLAQFTEIGQQIHVKDLVVPAKMEILTDMDETVALIQAPEEEEVEVAAPATLVPEGINDVEAKQVEAKKED